MPLPLREAPEEIPQGCDMVVVEEDKHTAKVTESFFDHRQALQFKVELSKNCPCLQQTDSNRKQRSSSQQRETGECPVVKNFRSIHEWFDLHGRRVRDWPYIAQYTCNLPCIPSRHFHRTYRGRQCGPRNFKAKEERADRITPKKPRWSRQKRKMAKMIRELEEEGGKMKEGEEESDGEETDEEEEKGSDCEIMEVTEVSISNKTANQGQNGIAFVRTSVARAPNGTGSSIEAGAKSIEETEKRVQNGNHNKVTVANYAKVPEELPNDCNVVVMTCNGSKLLTEGEVDSFRMKILSECPCQDSLASCPMLSKNFYNLHTLIDCHASIESWPFTIKYVCNEKKIGYRHYHDLELERTTCRLVNGICFQTKGASDGRNEISVKLEN